MNTGGEPPLSTDMRQGQAPRTVASGLQAAGPVSVEGNAQRSRFAQALSRTLRRWPAETHHRKHVIGRLAPFPWSAKAPTPTRQKRKTYLHDFRFFQPSQALEVRVAVASNEDTSPSSPRTPLSRDTFVTYHPHSVRFDAEPLPNRTEPSSGAREFSQSELSEFSQSELSELKTLPPWGVTADGGPARLECKAISITWGKCRCVPLRFRQTPPRHSCATRLPSKNVRISKYTGLLNWHGACYRQSCRDGTRRQAGGIPHASPSHRRSPVRPAHGRL